MKEPTAAWRAVFYVAVGIILFGIAIWLLPSMIQPVSPDPVLRTADLSALTGVRTTLATGIVGLVALGGLYFSSLNQRTSERTYRLTERGQFTDRYAKYIEQLGSENVEVQLGGIYGLESFGAESDLASDQAMVVEVLSAFVRRRCPLPEFGEKTLAPIALQVQTALTVLGRLPFRAGVKRADLTNSQLTEANLTGADFRGAKLNGARFDRSDLTRANLRGASFFDTRFKFAILIDATVSCLDQPAEFDVPEFSDAQLDGADFSHAVMYSASFKNAHVSEANFSNATLCNSSFENATVTGSKIIHLGQMIVDGLDKSIHRTRGPANFLGSDLREVKGLRWTTLQDCPINEDTKLSGELKKAREQSADEEES